MEIYIYFQSRGSQDSILPQRSRSGAWVSPEAATYPRCIFGVLLNQKKGGTEAQGTSLHPHWEHEWWPTTKPTQHSQGFHHRLTQQEPQQSLGSFIWWQKEQCSFPKYTLCQDSVTEMDTAALPPAQEKLWDFVWAVCYKFRKILAQKTSIIH